MFASGNEGESMLDYRMSFNIIVSTVGCTVKNKNITYTLFLFIVKLSFRRQVSNASETERFL